MVGDALLHQRKGSWFELMLKMQEANNQEILQENLLEAANTCEQIGGSPLSWTMILNTSQRNISMA